jgi:hypothetical protein
MRRRRHSVDYIDHFKDDYLPSRHAIIPAARGMITIAARRARRLVEASATFSAMEARIIRYYLVSLVLRLLFAVCGMFVFVEIDGKRWGRLLTSCYSCRQIKRILVPERSCGKMYVLGIAYSVHQSQAD